MSLSAGLFGTVVLLVVGVVHLLPVTGVLGSDRLQLLYGVRVDDADLRILLRHRALLFAVIGGLMMAGALHAPWRLPAMVAGLVSMVGFLLVATLEGGGNAALTRVFRIDVAAAIALLLALVHDVVGPVLRGDS